MAKVFAALNMAKGGPQTSLRFKSGNPTAPLSGLAMVSALPVHVTLRWQASCGSGLLTFGGASRPRGLSLLCRFLRFHAVLDPCQVSSSVNIASRV